MIHENLEVWKKAMEMAKAVYKFTDLLPKSENYGLVSQMQRAAVSVPSNISEGAGRNTTKDYLRFLHQSLGSLNELSTQYELCLMLDLCSPQPKLSDQIDHTGKLLMNQIKSLRRKIQQP